MNKNIKLLMGIIIVVLISTASFFFYYLVRHMITDLFTKFGIESIYIQSVSAIFLIITLVVILTMVIGRRMNIFKTVRDILKT